MAQVHEFGPFRYDAEQRALFRDGQAVPLMPKAADMLHVLLERRGRIVSKGELMKLVWPDCVVEEVGLARNISLLRKALGEEAERYIETVPKRGYRFAAEAAGTRDEAPAPPRLRRGARLWLAGAGCLMALGLLVWQQFYRPSPYLPAGERFASLAVVPFERLGGEAEVAAFSEGMAEVLAAELSKLESVHVMSPATVERYRRLRLPVAFMARILGLHMTLEGTVQKAGGGVRVVARLSDVHSGKLIWAETYEELSGEPGESQVQLARAVAKQIGVRVAAAPAARN
jgi:DNA-binding winged helix-turn-helix (wHTH) protein/TolB-like protein